MPNLPSYFKFSRLSWLLLAAIGLILGGGYLLFYLFGHSDCIWSGKAQAWLDQDENGAWDVDEPALARVQFLIDDTYNDLIDVGARTWSDETGAADLSVWLPGCPRTTFEIYARPPAKYRPTTPLRLAEHRANLYSFGFVIDN